MVTHLELDPRKQTILKYVVHDYIATAEPVASRTLVLRYQLQVKSATVRHELAEMSEMGYLRQPHTSAGRIPSDRGYRVYVDYLMPAEKPSPALYEKVERLHQRIGGEVEEILIQTCRILAGATKYTAVASTPQPEAASVRQVVFTQLDRRHVLMVCVLNDSSVKHRILDAPGPLKSSQLAALGDVLVGAVSGEIPEQELLARLPSPDLEQLYRRAASVLKEILRPEPTETVFVEGTSYMVRQPEFKDGEKLEPVLSALEERRCLLEMMRQAANRQDVVVTIGEESPEPRLKECSFVAAPYRVSSGSIGAIGVIGPTRMEYRIAVPTVGLMAKSLSDMFCSMGIG